jgi:hypothetical protein
MQKTPRMEQKVISNCCKTADIYSLLEVTSRLLRQNFKTVNPYSCKTLSKKCSLQPQAEPGPLIIPKKVWYKSHG